MSTRKKPRGWRFNGPSGAEVLKKDEECWVTVVIPEILPARWWQNILHNQRALMLKGALLFKDRVILTDVPYHLTR